MATYLYRLGRFSFRHRWWVIGVWLALLVAAGVGSSSLSRPMATSFSIPGTESQRAMDLLAERMPGQGVDGTSAQVVFVASDSAPLTAAAHRAAVEDAVGRLGRLDHVLSVTDPYATGAVSRSGTTAYTTVTYRVPADQLTDADRQALAAAGNAAASGTLRVEFAGEASRAPVAQGGTEGIGLAVAAVVLLITFGSLLAAGLPLVTALVGVGLGVLGIQIATHFVDLSQTSLTLSLMLGLAVAIDYALFVVSRYRHELLAGHEGPEAAGRAVGTAGSAVVFAGATVVIALAALFVVGIPFLTAMGLAAAGTVAVSVVIALTLLPALLSLAGRRILGRRGAAARDTEASSTDSQAGSQPDHRADRRTAGERWARTVTRFRIPVVLAVVVGLGILALPARDLTLGMPGDGTASPSTTQRRAFDALAEGFGPGVNGPLVVVLDLVHAADRTAAVRTVQEALPSVPGVAAVAPARLDRAGDTAILVVVPTTGPLDKATQDTVAALRSAARTWDARTGAVASVTGATAVEIDISDTMRSALLPYLSVVVGLAILLLLLVFRSVLVPLKATLGFLLSVATTFGAVVAVFQWGWLAGLIGLDSTGPVLSFLPIFLVGILFGLAMDYEVFLVSRMREEFVHGATPQDAVLSGFGHGARVVTAAGVIMFSVFAGFVLADEAVVKSMGFALAAGVLVDAFLVRMTLVPAVMSLLGRAAWWLPSWLDRLLPNVDIEGEQLLRRLRAAEPAGDVVPAQRTRDTLVPTDG